MYSFLGIWFLLLNIIILTFIHVILYINNSFLYIAECIPLYGCTAICLSSYLLMDIWLYLVWGYYQ